MLTKLARSTTAAVIEAIQNRGEVRGGTMLSQVFREAYAKVTAGAKPEKTASGVSRTALIFRTCVVKTLQFNIASVYDERDFREFLTETKFINAMRATRYAKHFPEVMLFSVKINGVMCHYQLGEKIALVADRALDRKYGKHVQTLAAMCGVGDDMHPGNYGWKFDPKTFEPYPVFVDVECNEGLELAKSLSSQKSLSWMI